MKNIEHQTGIEILSEHQKSLNNGSRDLFKQKVFPFDFKQRENVFLFFSKDLIFCVIGLKPLVFFLLSNIDKGFL